MSSAPRTSTGTKALVGVWVLVVFAAFGALWKYKLTRGANGEPSRSWPATSHLAHTPGKPTLLFFAHPRCPCTRASVAELNSIMGRFAGKVTAEVVFMHAGGEPEAWSQSDSFVRAQSIPGVSVTSDRDGHEAALFGALTSGHVMLYDRAGALTFSGGITPARGHEGDSPARQRLLALLAEETSAPVPNRFASALVASGAVYGCSLEDGPR